MKPMLAAKANPSKLRYPLWVQIKLDGIRCVIVGGTPLTRTLKAIPNAEIRRALSQHEFEGLDGEIIVGDPTAPDCYRRTSSFVMSPDKTGEPWTFHVFDMWRDPSAPYTARYRTLQMLFTYNNAVRGERLKLVLNVPAHDVRMLEEIEVSYIDQGHEGVILRDPASGYKFGRASATAGELLKLKRYDDFEAEVIGVYEEQHNGNEAVTNALGRTERSTAQAGKTGKGRAGGLYLRGLTGYVGVEFKCGTGFNAAERATIWADRENVVGKVVKIKHFTVGAKDKPRFPTFIGWRDRSDF